MAEPLAIKEQRIERYLRDFKSTALGGAHWGGSLSERVIRDLADYLIPIVADDPTASDSGTA